MLSKTLQKRRQIDAWELDERELETKTDREMSMMSMMSTQLHLQCFNRPAALHTFYVRNKEVKLHFLKKEVGVSWGLVPATVISLSCQN